MISREGVEHIAKLARIGIDQEEVKKFQGDLDAILDYVRELKELNTEGVEPTSQVTDSENVMRPDLSGEETSEEVRRNLVEAAPAEKDGYIKTKAIL